MRSKTMRNVLVATLIFLATFLGIVMIMSQYCLAEEVPTAPTEEVAPSETPVETPSETPSVDPSENVPPEMQGHLKRLLWFIDDELFTMIISALGVVIGLLVMIVPVVKGAKSLKEIGIALGGKKEDLQGALQELGQVANNFKEYGKKLEDKLANQDAVIDKILKICEVAFTNDAQLIANGGADLIKQISGVVNGNEQREETNELEG